MGAHQMSNNRLKILINRETTTILLESSVAKAPQPGCFKFNFRSNQFHLHVQVGHPKNRVIFFSSTRIDIERIMLYTVLVQVCGVFFSQLGYKNTIKNLNFERQLSLINYTVHLSKREGVRPVVPGLIGCILRYSNL